MLESSLRGKRWLLLTTVLVIAALMGVGQTLVPDSPALLLGAVGSSTAIPILCLVDSRMLGKPVSPGFLWATILLWPVTVPCYLLWSRGLLKGAALSMLFGVLYILALSVPAVAARLLVG